MGVFFDSNISFFDYKAYLDLRMLEGAPPM